jgi:fructose-1,6-bisphosphatase/inositol monophosphatase family enzyme
LREYLNFAKDLAHKADSNSLKYFRSGLGAEPKAAAGSPVTAADREVEAYMRAAKGQEYPLHGILGEEDEETKRVAVALDCGTLSTERRLLFTGCHSTLP